MSTSSRSPRLTTAQLDHILGLQILVAWAGEAETDPPRQGWWRTAMVDEYGGVDFLARLTPRTWRWGVLQTARLAAMRVDARTRARAADPDAVVTLFNLDGTEDSPGQRIDERLADRFAEHARSQALPERALPILAAISAPWAPEQFARAVAEHTGLDKARFTETPVGRQLSGSPPGPLDAARSLCAALLPLNNPYPTPHYLVAR